MKAVLRVIFFHSVPLNILYRRDEVYPANTPMNTHKRTIAVMSPPRFAGDKNPSSANITVTSVIPKNCTPVPT
uniref:Uncharacterized protein n=1 Tax=Arundo donax TaxID=35708 RepID=A0A0A9D2P5_ARUDO